MLAVRSCKSEDRHTAQQTVEVQKQLKLEVNLKNLGRVSIGAALDFALNLSAGPPSQFSV